MSDYVTTDKTQPILVVLVWRGGKRFQRALDSIRLSEEFFQRIILSVTSTPEAEDMRLASDYLLQCELTGNPSKAEIICTNRELGTMDHQHFWITHLLKSRAPMDSPIFWLAYDDEIRPGSLAAYCDERRSWPILPGHAYFGPWAMRHESASRLWDGDPLQPLESWTSFHTSGPNVLRPIEWASEQLLQPTYIQMSGSVAPLSAHFALVNRAPRKSEPMRIELATALSDGVNTVTEFPTPLVTIYGRSDSDRASYGKRAWKQDLDLAYRLFKHLRSQPALSTRALFVLATNPIRRHVRKILGKPITEEWRVQTLVNPS